MTRVDDAKMAISKSTDQDNANSGGIAGLIDRMMPQIKRALPKHMRAERAARIMITELRGSSKLQRCNPMSFLAAMMHACQLGLEPGPLKQCYFVPYGDQVQLIIAHRGYIELARRYGAVRSTTISEVAERDDFDFAYGTDQYLRHRPALTDRGPTIGYYCLIHMPDGSASFTVMGRDEVERVRKQYSRAKSGPWFDDYDAQGRKTVIKRHYNYQPLSPELANALASDEAIVTADRGDLTDLQITQIDNSQAVDAEAEAEAEVGAEVPE